MLEEPIEIKIFDYILCIILEQKPKTFNFISILCLPCLPSIQGDPCIPAFTCLLLITTSISTLFFGNAVECISQYFPFNYGVWTLGICHFCVEVSKGIVARKKE